MNKENNFFKLKSKARKVLYWYKMLYHLPQKF